MSEEPSNFEQGVSEMEFVNARDIVLALKAVKEKEHLTIPEILTKLELAGANVSESTVRRVFRDNSENEGGFTYIKVLKPIADVLLNEEETADDPALLEKNDALHSIIKEKNRLIEELQGKADTLAERNEELKREIDNLKKEYDLRFTKLWEQVSIKDRRMDEKDEIIKRLMDKCL